MLRRFATDDFPTMSFLSSLWRVPPPWLSTEYRMCGPAGSSGCSRARHQPPASGAPPRRRGSAARRTRTQPGLADHQQPGAAVEAAAVEDRPPFDPESVGRVDVGAGIGPHERRERLADRTGIKIVGHHNLPKPWSRASAW